ncbi:MAG: translation initiation factor eIF-2B [Bdellovibrionales bacterium]|nr:translation initiation factor eIF-2B [Bdellovibrionales bacterium]
MKSTSFEAHSDHVKILSASDNSWKEIKDFQQLTECIHNKHIISSVFATQCFLFLCQVQTEEFLSKITNFKKLYPISTYAQLLLTRLEMVSNNSEVCISLIQEILDEEKLAIENCAKNINSMIQNSERILIHSHSGHFESVFGGRIVEALKLANAENKDVHVFLINTPPKQYALNLMATELKSNNITFTLAPDTAAAILLKKSKVQKVFTTAKRMAANGDTVIDAGAYSLALFCDHHSISFYSCGYHTMFDNKLPTGDSFSIQFTEPELFLDKDTFQRLESPRVYAPEVDVVPAKLITAWIMDDKIYNFFEG